jgi:hypothetical protein
VTQEEHKERHAILHRNLDELVADWITQTGKVPSKGTVLDLIRWSSQQAENPTDNSEEAE